MFLGFIVFLHVCKHDTLDAFCIVGGLHICILPVQFFWISENHRKSTFWCTLLFQPWFYFCIRSKIHVTHTKARLYHFCCKIHTQMYLKNGVTYEYLMRCLQGLKRFAFQKRGRRRVWLPNIGRLTIHKSRKYLFRSVLPTLKNKI